MPIIIIGNIKGFFVLTTRKKMSNTGTIEDTKIEEEVKLQRPVNHVVIFHNDDKTTFEFVISVLVQLFGKEIDDAYQITKAVHDKGSAVVASYPEEIAREKANMTIRVARKYNYPLRVTHEPES